ncbi:MAG: aminopeptidase P family N-terminal domain-containing protein, partial [Prolixibacteraceae bacterium]|nr:aminopeptidase P family N-terminal domain-containing protein [Prolixibacteraceae bacterium]
MNNNINNRIKKIRELMLNNGLSAFLINGSDPHLSEYVPDRWKTRDYLSGFTGSFGFMAIIHEQSLLWTDSRYYLQAEQQLEGTGIEMMKAREPESISLEQWLFQNLKNGNIVGFDGTCYAAAEIKQLKQTLNKKGIIINDQIDLIDDLWENRPSLPNSKAFLHPINLAGKSRTEKISQLRDLMHKSDADCSIISALDDLAWTFNIRGADVECNPVVLGYGIVSKNEAMLFTHS